MTLQQALALHQAGQLDEAEQIYRQLLEEDASNPDALHLLGLLAAGKHNYSEAEHLILLAISLTPEPLFFDSLGDIYEQQGKTQEAAFIYEKLVEACPDDEKFRFNLGRIQQQLGNSPSAVQQFEAVLELNPMFVPAYVSLGSVYQEQGAFTEALNYFQLALQANPTSTEAALNLGSVLQTLKRFDEAQAVYRQLLVIDPNLPGVYNNLGLIAHGQGHFQEAIEHFQRALHLHPDNVDALVNLGISLQKSGDYETALSTYQQAISVDHGAVEAYNNLGSAYQEQGCFEEASKAYQLALKVDPDYVFAHWNQAHTWLMSGDFTRGWDEFEWRWCLEEFEQRKYTQPLWDGSLQPKATILVYAEQGLGDTFQFVRFLPWVKSQCSRVILECQPGLKRILQQSQGFDEIYERGEALPPFDYYISTMSLPRLAKTQPESIPATIPYIVPTPDAVSAWRERLSHESRFKVGLVWAGSTTNQDGRFRACPLEHFAPLGHLSQAHFYGLQKGPEARQGQTPPEGMNFTLLEPHLSDFLETAAVIQNLDLVISVDTSVAHLAGAMGKPVWTLLPSAADWRWMYNRQDSPWYPTMRLFRQRRLHDWDELMQRVFTALEESLTARV